MNYYGAKDLAASFRTVRKNTIQIANEIPEDKYDFRASPESSAATAPSSRLSRSPPSALSGPWQAKQRLARIG